jgi:hypothetical protein
MSISWTTLQEQILAKLRRPYRSEADMNEVGHDPNRLQIFHFCCLHGNKQEKSKPCCHTLFEVKPT